MWSMKRFGTNSFFLAMILTPGACWSQEGGAWVDGQTLTILQQKWPDASPNAQQKYRFLAAQEKPPMPSERKQALKKGVLNILGAGAEFVKAQEIPDEGQRLRVIEKLKDQIDGAVVQLGDKEPQFLDKDGGLGEILGAIKGEVQFSEEAIKRNPNSSEALTWGGQAYSENGDPKKAKEYFDQALKQYPNNSEALSGRAVTNYNLGDKAKASEDALAALRIDPHNKSAFTVFKLSEGREPSKIDLDPIRTAFDTKDFQGNLGGSGIVEYPRRKGEAKLPYVLQQKFGGIKDPPKVNLAGGNESGPMSSGIPPLLPVGAAVGGLVSLVAFQKREDKTLLIAGGVGVGMAASFLFPGTPPAGASKTNGPISTAQGQASVTLKAKDKTNTGNETPPTQLQKVPIRNYKTSKTKNETQGSTIEKATIEEDCALEGAEEGSGDCIYQCPIAGQITIPPPIPGGGCPGKIRHQTPIGN